jgi:hypothetical protein
MVRGLVALLLLASCLTKPASVATTDASPDTVPRDGQGSQSDGSTAKIYFVQDNYFATGLMMATVSFGFKPRNAGDALLFHLSCNSVNSTDPAITVTGPPGGR